jgi:hypothetical protein
MKNVENVKRLETKLQKTKSKKNEARNLRDKAESIRVEAAKKLEMLHQNLRMARAAKCFKRSSVNKGKITEVLNLLRKGRQYNREAIFLLYKMQNLRSKKVDNKK